MALLTLAWAPLPVQAAEQVFLDLGPFSRAVPTDVLMEFAETGTARDQLAVFLRRLSPEQQDTLRTVLTTSREVDLAPISQWFYTAMGEQTLLFLGKFAQTEARLNGQQALRAAIIAAAAEDGDIALIDVIQHFPSASMRLDVGQVLNTGQQIADEVSTTRQLIDTLRQQVRDALSQAPAIDLATLPDLTQPGPYGSRRISLVLEDTTRNRTVPAVVYVPQNLSAIQGTIPVVVISHGLGDSPASFVDIASHVASHGFAVALPEHIGSNFSQKQAMFSWLSDEPFKAREFLDRPLDVSYLLDELERLNGTTFEGKLDVSRVAAVGHSFGGYTALALAGATVDFERLAQRCDPQANLIVDAALVLECQALELIDQPEVVQQLGETSTQDERVKLVMAFAPVSNLLGPR
ncbi:MAG: alpha/beta fold hydrolase, partial [Leptolyngbyaceae cyanobacterium SM2_5_2]|nr:alpha/beta fold hydrolase [Leptolyngbyaceae cyanobacterium SM2_5_2]